MRRVAWVLVMGLGLMFAAWAGGATTAPQETKATAPSEAVETEAAPEGLVLPPTGGPVEGEPTKFCPIGGETYPAEMTYCPEHGVELKARE